MADDLAGTKSLALHQLHRTTAVTGSVNGAAQVAIDMLIVPRADHQAVATATVLDHLHQPAAPPVANRSPEGGGDVDAVVGAQRAGEGMDPHAEGAGVTRKAHHRKNRLDPTQLPRRPSVAREGEGGTEAQEQRAQGNANKRWEATPTPLTPAGPGLRAGQGHAGDHGH